MFRTKKERRRRSGISGPDRRHRLNQVPRAQAPQTLALRYIQDRFLRRRLLDTSNDNELGFEWILMEMLPRASSYDKWRYLTFEMKKQLVDMMARYSSQLFYRQLRGIGGISDSIGEICQINFFWDGPLKYDVSHGPFMKLSRLAAGPVETRPLRRRSQGD